MSTGTQERTSAKAPAKSRARRRPFGRPLLYTSYESEMALLNTGSKRMAVGLLLVLGALVPMLLEDAQLQVAASACVAAIGAIGLGLVTGYAGQVSLGHAFFLGVGAYTAAVLSGDPNGRSLGFGIQEIWIWLPAAGIAAAIVGILVAPLATRLRGLYLAIVTLGLVFIGEYFFSSWTEISGGANIGRAAPVPVLFGERLNVNGAMFTKDQKIFWLVFVLMVIFALAARNIARSRVGRAFTAIRDRDIAAGVMGVSLARYKTVAFGVSSFYAGCCGALFYITTGYFTPERLVNLEISVLFIAMVLVGGAGTISGAILGAFFFTYLPVFVRWVLDNVPPEFAFISTSPTGTPNVFHLQTVLYGALIVIFLIFEPRGLFGIWLRIRNYWKAWPFSY